MIWKWLILNEKDYSHVCSFHSRFLSFFFYSLLSCLVTVTTRHNLAPKIVCLMRTNLYIVFLLAFVKLKVFLHLALLTIEIHRCFIWTNFGKTLLAIDTMKEMLDVCFCVGNKMRGLNVWPLTICSHFDLIVIFLEIHLKLEVNFLATWSFSIFSAFNLKVFYPNILLLKFLIRSFFHYLRLAFITVIIKHAKKHEKFHCFRRMWCKCFLFLFWWS